MKMNPLYILFAFALLGNVRAIVELDCSDNATCINHMAKEILSSLRQQKSVRVFDFLTIEPEKTRQARAKDYWLTNFLDSHSFSFDWNDYTFKLSQADDNGDALNLEIYEGRTAKDVSDPNAKKSSSKNEDKAEDKTSKAPHRLGLRRRQKKKVMQAVVPLLFGMKSAGVVMFAMAVVTVLTLKAFFASKMALLVTVGMAVKRLYETYGNGVGLQNHPYLYSQYPIDFPSASSHAYSVSGVSSQFASPEMYSPTAMGQVQANEIIQQSDASAQQSQQAPQLLYNSTRAAERWDGKSKLLKFLEPIVDGVKSIVDPIASAFFGAIPATFRGLNSDVSTAKSVKPDEVDEVEIIKKPRQILVPQPRNIAQRKMTHRKNTQNPKKYSELNVSLDRLKHNKDLHDYIRTKKYKYNYPNTFFYPRVKYFVNPNTLFKPNNSRLVPYLKEASSIKPTIIKTLNESALNYPIIGNPGRQNAFVKTNISRLSIQAKNTQFYPNRPNYFTNSNSKIFQYKGQTSTIATTTVLVESEWKPIVLVNHTFPDTNKSKNKTRKFKKQRRRNFRRKPHKKRQSRSKRSIDLNSKSQITAARYFIEPRITSTGRTIFDFIKFLFSSDPIGNLITQTNGYTKSVFKHSLKSKEPTYYKIAYDFVMMALDVLNGYIELDVDPPKYVSKKRYRKKNKIKHSVVEDDDKKENNDSSLKNKEIKGNCTQNITKDENSNEKNDESIKTSEDS